MSTFYSQLKRVLWAMNVITIKYVCFLLKTYNSGPCSLLFGLFFTPASFAAHLNQAHLLDVYDEKVELIERRAFGCDCH